MNRDRFWISGIEAAGLARAMLNLDRFKYSKNRPETSVDIPDVIPETPTKTNGATDHVPGPVSISSVLKKKRKYDSDDEALEDIPKHKKTRITHFLKKEPEAKKKKTSHDFISEKSGSDADSDKAMQENDEPDNRLVTLKEMFAEFSDDTLKRVCSLTLTTDGAIAILTQWKSEDIKNRYSQSPPPDSQNLLGNSSIDSPLFVKRKKNCLRLDSAEKNFDSDYKSLKKRTAKRLGLSSSDSESDDDGPKPRGPFPRLSCVVTNSGSEEYQSLSKLEKDLENGTDKKEAVADNGISQFYSESSESIKIEKNTNEKASKQPESFVNDTLTMDNPIDENFSVDYDSESSEKEFSESKRPDKYRILEFFQKAETEELVNMHSCSRKKAEIIAGLRPFKSWNDLVRKIEETKYISSELIHNCADLLKEREILKDLLHECRRISNDLAAEIESLHCHEHMTEGSALMKAPKTIPSHLQLKAYQLVGLNWIALLHRNKVNGVLADEMGLGKTVQTIAFLAYLLEQDPNTGPHLIVVPSSTLDNWCRELSLWCPTMDVVLYRGSQSERRTIRAQFLHGKTTNIIVTTYNSAISTPEDRLFFRKLVMEYAVFDEGHMLKNMSSQRYLHLMKIKAARKLLLTGTPLQNNLLELMSLLRFVMPHMFEQTTDTLVRIFSTSNSGRKSRYAKDRIKDAKDIMQPFVLRRLKNEVLKQLPDKLNEVILCEVTSNQRQLYEETKEKFRLKLNKQSVFEMKNIFVELRKIANHPLLRRHWYTADKLAAMAKLLKKEREYNDSNETFIVEDMTVMTDFELHCFCQNTRAIRQYALDESKIWDSGKFKILDKLLPQFKEEGCRIAIFSQFKMVLDILEEYLKSRSHKFLRLDGSTAVDTRLGLIDQFDSDSSILVFLLSTKAGGLGINLTSANAVIIHDIDMNPYNDKQAEDRCHRLGQTRDVKVLRLISKCTLEEGMLQLAQNKLELEQDMTANEDDASDIAALLRKTLAK